MKSIMKLFGNLTRAHSVKVPLVIIALVTVFGFSFALTFTSCDNGMTSGSGGGINGTWINQAGERWVFNNGNFTVYSSNVEAVRGTYTTRGNSLTITFTQIKGSTFGSSAAQLGISANQWYTKSQFRTAVINYAVSLGATQSQATVIADDALAQNPLYDPMTGTYSVDGNTLTIDGAILTRY